MLEVLLGSRLRARVLGWLFTHVDERYFVRQLTKILGEDSTNVSRELSRLEKIGILISTSEGKQKYFQVNRKNPAFEELHGLIIKTYGIADVLRSALAVAKDKISLAFIFGSISAGRENRESDIDIVIIGKITFSEAVSLISPAQEILGREINPVVYAVAEFKRRIAEKHHFVSSVMEGEKIFIIGDEYELARMVGGKAGRET